MLRRALICAVAGLALAGCGSRTTPPATTSTGATTPAPAPAPTTPTLPAPAQTGSFQVPTPGQTSLLAMPPTPTSRVVVYVHGAGEKAGAAVVSPLAQPLLDAGYAIAASDAHGNAFGNPQSTQDYVSLVRWLHGKGLTDVYVLAASMGGLAGLQLIDAVHPRAFAGLYAACNLRALYDLDGSFTAPIRNAFGITDLEWKPDMLSPVDPQDVAGLPMIFWASPQDHIVPKATNTDVCAADAQAKGAQVTVVETTGEHGDRSNFDAPRLVAFFDAAPR